MLAFFLCFEQAVQKAHAMFSPPQKLDEEELRAKFFNNSAPASPASPAEAERGGGRGSVHLRRDTLSSSRSSQKGQGGEGVD